EDAKKIFEEAKTEAEACYAAAEKARDEVPQSVKDAISFIIDKVKAMMASVAGDSKAKEPGKESVLGRAIAEVEKQIGKLADEAKTEAEACFAAAEKAMNDVPQSVKDALKAVVDKVKALLPQADAKSDQSPLAKAIKEIEKKIGQVADEAKKLAETAKKKFDE